MSSMHDVVDQHKEAFASSQTNEAIAWIEVLSDEELRKKLYQLFSESVEFGIQLGGMGLKEGE